MKKKGEISSKVLLGAPKTKVGRGASKMGVDIFEYFPTNCLSLSVERNVCIKFEETRRPYL